MKAKVKRVNIGADCDSVVIDYNNSELEVCFPKDAKVSQYDKKIVDIEIGGRHTITEHKEEKFTTKRR